MVRCNLHNHMNKRGITWRAHEEVTMWIIYRECITEFQMPYSESKIVWNKKEIADKCIAKFWILKVLKNSIVFLQHPCVNVLCCVSRCPAFGGFVCKQKVLPVCFCDLLSATPFALIWFPDWTLHSLLSMSWTIQENDQTLSVLQVWWTSTSSGTTNSSSQFFPRSWWRKNFLNHHKKKKIMLQQDFQPVGCISQETNQIFF